MSNKKEKEELEVSRYFVSWLNTEKSYDYSEPEKTTVEGSPIDTFAVSASDKYPRLNLQLRTAEDRLQKTMREAERFPNTFISYMADDRDIHSAYKAKVMKYAFAEQNNLLLILHRRHGPLLDPKNALEIFEYISLSDFAGVYYVRMPCVDSHGGQVLPFKWHV